MKQVYYNGVVYTGELPCQSAFIVEDGKFVSVGDDVTIKSFISERDECIDLDGKFVCASFNDSHMHLLNFGQSLNMAQLAQHTTSLEELISYMKEFYSNNEFSNDHWLTGRGWNQDYFSDVDRMPTRYDLDEISTEVPIAATRCCGHCMVVNSKVLELLGIDETTQSPEGGKIGMEDGKLDGRFYDNACALINNHVPLPDKETLKNYIRSACKALNAFGVTSSQSDDYCVFREIPWQTVNEAFKELEESGELTVRVYEQSNFTSLETLKEFVEAGNNTGVGSDLFKIGPLKMLGDGSLGARTAYLSKPYEDDPSTVGFPLFSQKEFDEMVGYANENGMQVAIHSIGDGVLDMILSAIEKALKEHPRKDHRHGIIHCQITREEQLQKIADLNLHVYAQAIFLDYDIHIIEDRVGKQRASTSYAWETLMNKGVSVSNGTDCPVELPDALACMQCAVTRSTLKDHLGPYLPEEAFSVKEALDSYTIESAKGSFEENVKGLIKEGYIADFVVLGKNPFEVDVNAIKDIPVCATYLGGHEVYSK